ncbi:hypothetical protein [Brevibacterium otitidis]|uniref:Uncharacterized protein n=2 Tax=Brevibacterium otitidis TaxID=53364 RepID=A0ABV5WZN8_9MICO
MGGDFSLPGRRSTSARPLPELGTDELRSEWRFRRDRRADERRRRVFGLLIATLLAALMLGLAFVSYRSLGANPLAVICGLFAVVGLAVSAILFGKPNEREPRHMTALQEIEWLLRQRGESLRPKE